MILNYLTHGQQDNHNQLFISRKKAQMRDQAKNMMQELQRAVMLGNTYGESAIFHYVDNDGVPQVKEDIVQTVTARFVIFRGGENDPFKKHYQSNYLIIQNWLFRIFGIAIYF